MSYWLRKIRVFYQNGDLSSYLQEIQEALRKSIFEEPENYLLNVNEEEYTEYKVNEYRIEPLSIKYEQAYAEHNEELIPAELFPRDFLYMRVNLILQWSSISIYQLSPPVYN